MDFRIVGQITQVEVIVSGPRIRVLRYLRKSLWPRTLAKVEGRGDGTVAE
jgi:hypothetical protein